MMKQVELPAAGRSEKKGVVTKGKLSESEKYHILLRIIKTANDKLDPSSVMRIIMDNIQQLIPCEAWSILVLTPEGEELEFERARGQVAPAFVRARLKVGEGIAGWVAQHRKPLLVNSAQKDRRFNRNFDNQTNFITRSILCAPLISRNRLLGVVELINKKSKDYRFTNADLKTLATLLGPISVSLHNALLYREAQALTLSDDLTRLYNSRYVFQWIGNSVQRYKKLNKPFSIIFLDLDGFKTVNDRYGHLVGGRTLIEIGKIIAKAVRKRDRVARYGGDEFVVMLPAAGEAESMGVAEKIRLAIQNYDFQTALQKEIHLSASFGVAVFPEHGETATDLIQKADQAMYRVKYSGKNAVCSAGGSPALHGLRGKKGD
jgi:diguanylate cyclase (GGDEF)-like protein